MQFRQAGIFVGTVATCAFTMLVGSVGPAGLHLDTLGERIGIHKSPPPPPDQVVGDRLTREVWADVAGRAVSDIPLETKPTRTGLVGRFETPMNVGDEYGQRLRGYLTAPATGDYTFWISGDDQAELWLSTSEGADDKVKIAWHGEWTEHHVWDRFSTQRSKPIPLVEGAKYYIEALMKEGTGNDGVAVGWSRPGEPTNQPSDIIPGEVLSPM